MIHRGPPAPPVQPPYEPPYRKRKDDDGREWPFTPTEIVILRGLRDQWAIRPGLER